MSITANLQALGIIPREPSPSASEDTKSNVDSPPSTRDSADTKGKDFSHSSPLAPTRIPLTPRMLSSAPLSQKDTPRATPAPRLQNSTSAVQLHTPSSTPKQQAYTPTTLSEENGLNIEEIIPMIAGYRGHDKGLAGQSKKSLLSLLKYYEVRGALPLHRATLMKIRIRTPRAHF